MCINIVVFEICSSANCFHSDLMGDCCTDTSTSAHKSLGCGGGGGLTKSIPKDQGANQHCRAPIVGRSSWDNTRGLG